MAAVEEAKAATEAELVSVKTKLAATETSLKESGEELHAVQRAKDGLEHEIGEAARVLQQHEVAAEEAMEAQRLSAEEKARAAAEVSTVHP